MKQKYFCLLLVCFVFYTAKLYAQQPGFTFTLDKNCVPAKATFTNTSTGFSTGATYTINFGEGGDVAFPSTQPTHSYLTGGIYTATLTVTDNSKTYTATNQIVIYKNPVVNFSTNLSKVCAKGAVTFTSTSAAGDGTITNYLWDFGDGNIADTSSGIVSHTYTSGNSIKAGLTVTNSEGCFASVTLPNIVTVLAAPKAGFSASTTTVCHVTDGLSFTNKTSGGAQPVSYLWNFGDGSTSTNANAVHSYTTKGKFTVRLAATSSEGCTDTSAGTLITVASSKSGITAPSLLCLNSNLTFTDSSSPKTAHPAWLLDGKTVANDVHQYTTTFTDTDMHTLQLVNTYGSCTDTATKIIRSQAAPVPSPFTFKLQGYCNASPATVFTEGGTGSVKWEWDFNNTTDTLFNPTSSAQNPTHTYPAPGTYNVKLRVTDASGCVGTVRQPVAIVKNTTSITSTEGIFGCHNLTTTFKATSTTPIAQYKWTFSDSTSPSIADTIQHTFANLGGYSAFVTIKTTSGCTDTSRLKLYIGDEPNFNFAVLNPADTSVCGNKMIKFKVTGNSDSLIGTYYWNFGDAPTYTLVNFDSIYSHQYLKDGDFTVSMAIKNHGCNDTVTRVSYIHVIPPFSKIAGVAYNCDTRLKVAFKEASIKAQNYTWDFGDGSAPYTYDSAHRDTAVAHSFPGTNSYKVVLITSSGSCTVRDSVVVRTLTNQTPVLTALQTSICASDTLHTTVSGMTNNPWGGGYKYTVKAVQYNDGSPCAGVVSYPDISPANPFHINVTNLNGGNHQLRIITTSGYYNCPDTTQYISVQVNGPKAGFTVSDTVLCYSAKAVFTDVSKRYGSVPITQWQWLYGDGLADTLSGSGSTVHKFAYPGTFGVKLVVSDKNNCRDTAFYPSVHLTVNSPKAGFSVSQNPILPNTSETFINLTDSGYTTRINDTYTWLFGDGSSNTSNKDSIAYSYKRYGDDTVTLVAKNSATGCSDTASSVVHVKNTNLSFTYTSKFLNPASTCAPVLVSFKNTSTNFSTVSWNFGDSLTADNISTPTHTYYKPGVYKVTIYGYYADNSYDSSWEYISIAGPSATLQATALSGCGSRAVVFTAQTQNASSLLWDFGDGTSSSDSVATHVYTTPNVYMPTITVKNNAQCSASFSLSTPVAIDSLHISISKDSVLQCHQLLVNFVPTTFSVANNNGQVLDYTWQFGNGSSVSKKDTGTATYSRSGEYTVSLIATSPYGCKDTISTQVTYNDVHFAAIKGPVEFCENAPVAFTAEKTNNGDALSYHWRFQNDSSTLQNPPAQTFSASGNNIVTLWLNKNGCSDTVSQQLTIHAQPNVAMLLSDSLVCLGSPVLFDVKPLGNNSDTLNYFWNLGDGKDSATVKSASLIYANSGTYPVLLRTTSTFGCKEELRDTVAVSPSPRVFINAPIDICINGTVTFSSTSTTASSTQYLWHFPDNTTSTQQNPGPKTYTTAGANTVYLVASIGNCHDTAYHQLTVHDNPQVNLTTSAQRVCFGDSVQLTAHNGKDYQWSINNVVVNGTNVASPRLEPSGDTKYSVLAIDNYGCKNADSVTVHVVKHQHVSVASSLVNVCAGGTASLSASGTDNYNWINGTDLTATNIANPATIDSAQSKTYTVVGSDSYGCFTDTATVQVVVRNNPIIQVDNSASNITIPAGAPAQLSATSDNNIVKWNWQPAVYLSCNDCESPVSKPRQNLRYLVEGTDNYGCKGVDTVTVNVVCKENLAGVPEVFSPNGDGRNDRFGIVGYGIKNIKHFVIFGRNGNKVFERNNVSAFDTNATWDGMCNNVQMPSGTYVYIIEATCDAGEMYNLKGTVTLIR